MNIKSQEYLKKLHEMYDNWIDNDALIALAEVEDDEKRLSQMSSISDHPVIQEIIQRAVERYKVSIEMLTDRNVALTMTPEMRAYTFATMEWAQFTLDMLGQSSEMLERAIDDKVLSYAKKAGIV